MKKIIEVSSDTNIGGAGRCLLILLKELDRSKFDPIALIPKNSLLKPRIEELGVRVIEIDGMADKSLDWSSISKLKKIFKEEKADLIHAHASMSARIAGIMAGCKVVYTRHSVFDPPAKISKGIGKIINGAINNFFAHRIIAVAEAAKENLTKTGVSEKKIDVILNGVYPVQKSVETEALRERFGISDGAKVVSIIARLEDIKGHDYFIEAADILLKKGYNAKFVIAGTGSYMEHLKEKVSDLGRESDIIFTGFISDVDKLMSITDIQANASYGTEATSLSLLEGMSMGIPAVVSDFGGNPGVISHGQNGFIVKQKNSVELADAIEKLLKDEALYEKMSQESVKIFGEKFTAQVMTKNTEAVYLKVLEGKRNEKNHIY